MLPALKSAAAAVLGELFAMTAMVSYALTASEKRPCCSATCATRVKRWASFSESFRAWDDVIEVKHSVKSDPINACRKNVIRTKRQHIRACNKKGSIVRKIWEFFPFGSINVIVNISFLHVTEQGGLFG